MSQLTPILHTPTHLITGFLGAGKTTFLNACIDAFGTHERWALLINEVGDIGIDGALITKNTSLAVREINGGCICCTSQLPLQIALASLLKQHTPHRVWIEPTGLANPNALLDELSAPHWQTALSLHSCLALVNAKQWQHPKYQTHDGYQAHIRHADVVVVNRFDGLTPKQQQALTQWVHTLNPQAHLLWQQGITPNDALITQLRPYLERTRPTKSKPTFFALTPTTSTTTLTDGDRSLPYRYKKTQDTHHIMGWQLPAHWQADLWALTDILVGLPHWLRIKGVIHTPDGWYQLNYTPDSYESKSTDAHSDNRVEVILTSTPSDLMTLDEALLTVFNDT